MKLVLLRKLYFLLMCCSFCGCFNVTAYAKDFGIDGHTYKIIEEDMLKVMTQRLEKIDMEQFKQKLTEQTKQYVETPPAVTNVTKAQQTKEFFYDPTYVLQEEIRDHQGRIIHPKGVKINPLTSIPLSEALIFIDGDDEAQVDLALKTREKKQNRLKIILVKGSPLQLQRNHKVWIYFDQAGFIIQKLGISEVPALVEQNGLNLKITIVGDQDLARGKDLIGDKDLENSKRNKSVKYAQNSQNMPNSQNAQNVQSIPNVQNIQISKKFIGGDK